jgi:hypothetical protein
VGAAFSRDRINFYDFNDLNGFNDFYGFYDLPFTVYHSRLDESTTDYWLLDSLVGVLSPFPSQNIYNSAKKGGKYYEGCNEPYWDSNQDAQFQNEY